MRPRPRPVTFVNAGALSGVMTTNGTAFPPELFAPRLPEIEPGPIVAQGRLVDAIADGSVLRGTVHELAADLGVMAADLLEAVDELMAVGWLMLETDPNDALVLRWADEAVGAGRRGSRA